jgi:hypothetical protein
MTELFHLIHDGPVAPVCPFCNQTIAGEMVPYGGSHLHAACYEELGREWAAVNIPKEAQMANLTSVIVRVDDPDVDGYPIEDREGNVLGYSPTPNGPEQRAAVAQALGVAESDVAYKGDDEDDNGPVEVWGLRGVPTPVAN